MIARLARFAAALALSAPLAASAAAQGVEYAPGVMHYRVTSSTKVTQVTPMGSQEVDLGMRQLISVNVMRHSPDTTMAMLTLDSVTITSSAPTPDVTKLAGTSYTTLMSPTGKWFSTKLPDGLSPEMLQITEGVSRFLPAFRRDLSVGATWADTTTGKVTQQGIEMDRTIISRFTVLGDSTVNGTAARKIRRSTEVKASGNGSAQGTPVSLESVGTSTGAFLLTPAGVYLGGSFQDNVDAKITVLAQNMEITIKQAGTSLVEAVH